MSRHEWEATMWELQLKLHYLQGLVDRSKHPTKHSLLSECIDAMLADDHKAHIRDIKLETVQRYLRDCQRMSEQNVDDIAISWRRYASA